MTGAGLPTIHVYLDNGTGTFPYNITSYARLRDGYTITRGRSDELATVQPGTLTLTLDNSDGRFTLGSGTYGVHVDQQIRVAVTVGATTSNRFTGYVQSWPVEWPDGGDAFSATIVTAVDVSARWSRRTLKATLLEELLAPAPDAYYPLSEGAGSTAASDISGNGQPQLLALGDLPAVAFGAGTGPGTDGATATVFDAIGGQYLYAANTSGIGSPGSLYFEFFFACPSTPAAGSTFVLLELQTPLASTILTDLYVVIDPSGGRIATVSAIPGFAFSLETATGFCDGATHLAAFSYSGTAVEFYIDGVLLDSDVVPAGFDINPTTIVVGRQSDTRTLVAVTMSHVALGASITPAQIASQTLSAASASTERSDLRIDRLLGFEGALTTTAGDSGMVSVPNQDTEGKTVADAIQSVVDAEVGLLWINGSGQAQFANKDHVALATTPAMTIALGSDMVDPGTGFSVDMQQVTNYVRGQREGSDTVQTTTDPDSIATHGTYSVDETWLVQSDVEVLSRMQWLVTKYAEPSPRLPTLGLDLLTAEQADQISALALDLDSHILVTGWPSQTPGGSSTDLVAEGFTESLSDTGWDLVLNCASWTQQAAFILDDASWGVLDTNTLGI